MKRNVVFIFSSLFLALVLAGCRDMEQQPRYDPLEPSTFFADGRSARPLPTGVVPRSAEKSFPVENRIALTGMDDQGNPVTTIPMTVTLDTVKRGQERYNIYCSPCHGLDGYGQGMIVQRGFSPPPSFYSDRLRSAPDGHFYDVITNGFGTMYSYAYRIKPQDRWAIVAYIRALQLSQGAALNELSPEDLQKLGGGQP
jgi:mono/diheme cytochrome c family protein